MKVVLPQPVGPTMATAGPAVLSRQKSRISGVSAGQQDMQGPRPALAGGAGRLRDLAAPAQVDHLNSRQALAMAVCSWVSTPVTSLKGLVYWFA